MILNPVSCDVFELREGRIRRLISYLMETKQIRILSAQTTRFGKDNSMSPIGRFAALEVLSFALLLSAVACATMPPSVAAPPSTDPPPSAGRAPLVSGEFFVSSLDGGSFAFLGEFRGRYLVYSDSLVLTGISGTVVYVPRGGNTGPRRFQSIAVGLGQYTGDANATGGPVWTARPESHVHRVDIAMKGGERHQVEGLRFSIPIADLQSLPQRWLVFVLSSQVYGTISGRSYVHSDRKLFAALALPDAPPAAAPANQE